MRMFKWIRSMGEYRDGYHVVNHLLTREIKESKDKNEDKKMKREWVPALNRKNKQPIIVVEMGVL